ncbi:MAG: hypothetical protein J1F32_05470 [Erysipelotrichales bacterium]|nr:hypothetical protein [Erysipelotrichales bacterium]
MKIKCNKIDKYDYEIYIKPSKIKNILIYIFYLLFTAFEFYIYFSDTNNKGKTFPALCFISIIVHLYQLMRYYAINFHYAAIKEDKMYIHRYFGTKKMRIGDVHYIIMPFHIAFFYDSNKKFENNILYFFNSESKDFLAFLDKKRKEKICNVRDDEILTSLGQEYRINYENYKYKYIRNYIIYCVIVALVLCGMSAISKSFAFVFLFAIPYLILKFVILYYWIRNMDSELKYDDLKLGAQTKYRNKNVKGSSNEAFLSMSRHFLYAFFAFISIAFFASVFIEEPTGYEELTIVTGELKEYEVNDYGKYCLTLELEDNDFNYCLPSQSKNYCDFTFLDKINEGDSLTLLVEKDWRYNNKRNEDGILVRFSYICEIQFEGKKYFSYDDYINSFDNCFRADEITYYATGVSIVAASAVVITYFICKRKEKYESIEI